MSDYLQFPKSARVFRVAAIGGVALMLLVAIHSISAPLAVGAALPGFNAPGPVPQLAAGSIAAAAVASEPEDGDGSGDVGAYAPRTDQSRAAGRIRVRTAAGAFLVYDAAVPPDRPRKRAGFLAYWNDFASGESYVYGRLMITQADVGHALWDLEGDFGIDTVPLTMASSSLERGWIQAGRDNADETQWLPVSRWTMLTLMGFDPPDYTSRVAVDEGRIAIEGEDDPIVPCCLMLDPCCAVTASILPVYPEPPPIDTSPDDLIVKTLVALECCTTGGGGGGVPPPPPPPCNDPVCGCDRCCGEDSCCGNPDPCCNLEDPCCGNPDRCCNDDNPCCGSPDPCCNPEGPCCDSSDRCCNDDNPCCGNPDPCCNINDECCGNPDPCCNDDNPCCDNQDPCDPDCGDPCHPDCVDCNDADPCTLDHCSDGVCDHPPKCTWECCEGECCPEGVPCVEGLCCESGVVCGGQCCPSGGIMGAIAQAPTCCNEACCMTGMTCCGECCEPQNCCGDNCCSPGQECCADGTCCSETCDECIDYGDLSGGTVDVTPDPVCLGDTLTFTVSGVVDSGGQKRENCNLVNIPPGTIEYTWEITKPDTEVVTGSGPSADVVADLVGDYCCTFTATSERDCPPDSLDLDPADKTLAFTATLEVNPSSIPAKTPWAAIPDYSYSEVTVTWSPPECEGWLEVVELEPTDGYLPEDEGVMTNPEATLWRYDAFEEPQTELCPKTVQVWIGAMQGDEELARKSILVQPVHTWWTNGHKHGPDGQTHPPDTSDFSHDYIFLNLKYGVVLATTGGAFAGGIEISSEARVSCPWWIPFAPLVAACTYGDDHVEFGTVAFTGSENAAASIIGHELVHTTGINPALASECEAYTWEVDHQHETGLVCDIPYRDEVVQKQVAECPPD